MTRRASNSTRVATGPSEADEPTFSELDGIRYLHFATPWVQGGMEISDPPRLVFDYTQQMMSWLLFLDPPRSPLAIGTLGLGAGALARYCLRYTRSQMRVVEWNPRVTAACRAYFKLPPEGPRFSIEHEDAGLWVERPENEGSCRVLMVDLYDADARGPVRDSLSFYQACRRVVGGDDEAGMITVNLFGEHASFQKNFLRIQEAFHGRVMVLPELDEGNRVVLGFTGPPLEIDSVAFAARADAVTARYDLPAQAWARALSGNVFMTSAKKKMLHF